MPRTPWDVLKSKKKEDLGVPINTGTCHSPDQMPVERSRGESDGDPLNMSARRSPRPVGRSYSVRKKVSDLTII